MAMPFEPEEIDDLDETLLEVMDTEELEGFRQQLQDTLDTFGAFEPDPNENEEAYYEWQERFEILNDMIDAINEKLDS